MKRPDKKYYDFNFYYEALRFAKDMNKYVDHLEEKLKKNPRLEERRQKISPETTNKVNETFKKIDKETFRKLRSGGGIPLDIV